MTAVTDRLVSPSRRRVVALFGRSESFEANLRTLGWTDYSGPGITTSGQDEHGISSADIFPGSRNGWVIPGTDPVLDASRSTLTGSRD